MRLRAAAVVCIAFVLAPATATAADGVRIAGVDTSGYPQVRVTVVVPSGGGKPELEENGSASLALVFWL